MIKGVELVQDQFLNIFILNIYLFHISQLKIIHMPVHLYRTYGRTMQGKSIIISKIKFFTIRQDYPKSLSPERRIDKSINSNQKIKESQSNQNDLEFIKLNNLVEKLLKENALLIGDITEKQKQLVLASQCKLEQNEVISKLKVELEKLTSANNQKSPQRPMRYSQRDPFSPRNENELKTLQEENYKLSTSVKVLVHVNLQQKNEQIELLAQIDQLHHEISLNKNHHHGIECIRKQKENKEKLEITIELNNILKLKLKGLEQQYKECQQKLQQQQVKLNNIDQLAKENSALTQENQDLILKNEAITKKLEEYKKEQQELQILYMATKEQLNQATENKSNQPNKSSVENDHEEELKIIMGFNGQLKKQNEDLATTINDLNAKIMLQSEQINNYKYLQQEKKMTIDLIQKIDAEINLEIKYIQCYILLLLLLRNESYDINCSSELEVIHQRLLQMQKEKEALLQLVNENQDTIKQMMDEKKGANLLIQELNNTISTLKNKIEDLQNEIQQLKENIGNILKLQAENEIKQKNDLNQQQNQNTNQDQNQNQNLNQFQSTNAEANTNANYNKNCNSNSNTESSLVPRTNENANANSNPNSNINNTSNNGQNTDMKQSVKNNGQSKISQGDNKTDQKSVKSQKNIQISYKIKSNNQKKRSRLETLKYQWKNQLMRFNKPKNYQKE